MATKIEIKELNLDRILPNSESVKTDLGGSKITIIGKPGSGKSVLIKAILKAKSHLIPVGIAVSGTESTNHFYSQLLPQAFIYDEFEGTIIEKLHKRQDFAKRYLTNSWAVLVLDDCMKNTKDFGTPAMIGLVKNSRHWNLLSIFSNQFVLDFKPEVRSNIDGVFICREPNKANREKIWKNFASIIPTFHLFCQIMDVITTDHTCLYIDNKATSNDWQDCVFYYKAPMVDNFRFGAEEFWRYSEERCK